ncbi:Flagellar protein FliS [Anaerohalosphaera lusitana]|uniref:Flagellar protein FliS n=1 Tax=Anaerohalosphaera lusitana TaxID=1936003 RepID=A0A1U9NGM3_9BACT|nr:flagellar export chaperone FliS [Anaerohalosphaera lusitana]AQT66884.1 Flagellar protein FliS [Anaerohalosphaera lusitana]
MNGIGAYQETAVLTQSRSKLVVMLYDGAIKFMKLAIREMEAENFEEKGKYITKAQDIINELNAVLNMEAGGEIAVNLRKLYSFMHGHLARANAQNDPKLVEEVIECMDELNQAWKDICE